MDRKEFKKLLDQSYLINTYRYAEYMLMDDQEKLNELKSKFARKKAWMNMLLSEYDSASSPEEKEKVFKKVSPDLDVPQRDIDAILNPTPTE